MDNPEEAGRGVNPPRVVSIPGSQLDVEVSLLRRHINATLKARNPEAASYENLALTVRRLAEIEGWLDA